MLNLSPSEIVGKTNARLADTGAATLGLDLAIQQVLTTAKSLTVIHHFSVEGECKFYEVNYTPVLVQGQVTRVFSMGREITQYQRLVKLAQTQTAPDEQHPPTNGSPFDAATLWNQPIVGAEMPDSDSASIPAAIDPSDRTYRPLTHPLTRQRTGYGLERADQMRRNAELLQVVLDNIPQYIFWKDRNSVYLGCNRRWAEMAGIGAPENVVGMTEYDLPWTDEQKVWYLKCDRRVMDTNTPMLRIKESQLQADGQTTWRETSKLPIHDAEGNVIGLLGTIEDVTDRKRAEDLLRQSEAKFRQLAQREELLNRLSNQIRDSLNLDTTLQTVVREVRQLLDTDRVIVYRFGQNWQGSVIVEDVISPWDSVLGDIGADDCFAAQYAERYLQGRVRAIDDIHTAGLDECHVQFLAQMQVKANLIVPIVIRNELWGLLIAHECRGVRIWLETDMDLLEHLAGQAAIAIQQAELYAQAQAAAEQARSQTQQLQTTLYELQRTQTQLIQTEKMSSLGQLIAGIAHEINNPVNFIHGNLTYITNYVHDLVQLVRLYQRCYPQPIAEIETKVEMIELEFLIDDLSKILSSVRMGSERIRQIVLSLRNFSRLDEAEMKPVDIHEGIDSTLLILQHRLKNRSNGTEIQVVRHYGKLPPIECYAVQLNQVLMNIISNAIDALDSTNLPTTRGNASGSVQPKTITIYTDVLPGDRHAVIRICDNGAGIPAEIQTRLFDPFFTTKPVGKGTGLGLSISYQIVVEKHGGNLKCSSVPGQGTEFWIEIPISQGDNPLHSF